MLSSTLLFLAPIARAEAPRAVSVRSPIARPASCYSDSDVVRKVRDNYMAHHYKKPDYSLLKYQVWGGGRNFVTIVDTDGDFANGDWNSDVALNNRLNNVLNQYYQTQPDTAQFVALFSAFEIPFPGAFYLPLANDVTGIGYKHSVGLGPETFDSTDNSPLDGVIVMNDYTIWGDFGGVSNVFNQEITHRFAAFVHYQEDGGTDSDLLLGRDLAHWSFFMDTGSSPMEGNAWKDNGNGSFTTFTNTSAHNYCPLDLYLMGLIPPTDVPPFWFIDNPDLSSSRITRATTPALFGPVTLSGTKKTITIDDVIRAEGPRVPASDVAPKSFKIGFVLVVQKGQQTDQSLLNDFDSTLDDIVAKYEAATGNRATLEVVSQGPPPPPQKSIGDSCAGVFECDSAQSTACIAPKLNSSLGGFCSRRCSSTQLCPTGFCCSAANLIGDPRYCFNASLMNVCPADAADGGAPDGGTMSAPDAGMAATVDAGMPTDQDGGGSTGGGGGTPPPKSGGCAAAEGSAPGLGALLIALAGLWLARRRRESTST
jgi:MYXO-CTERM domain-containing protein